MVPGAAVRTKTARAALPAEVPIADAVFNTAHGALLVLGLARGDWDLVARGLGDRLHQPRREHLYPRSMELVRRARSLGALGATISGAGPTVLVWCHYEATAGVVEALRREAEGWAQVMRVPFELPGRRRARALTQPPLWLGGRRRVRAAPSSPDAGRAARRPGARSPTPRSGRCSRIETARSADSA